MAIMPDKDAEWASEDQQEFYDINGDGVDEVLENKNEPTDQWKKSGEKLFEPLPADYLNYQFDLIDKWLRHLKERYSIGDTHTTTSAEDATAISTRLGGTWVLVGTESLAGETNNVFRKTA